ncbi:recombinase family protein [Arthrobacter sp. NPDC092385]|uniref:recombinase family protein n=1 Tax=Arthrobacter sp. NPDC092385 TaxID=3363943 RepID=UPI00381ABD73
MSDAFIYCRISQDRSGEGLGVQRQEEDCRHLAASLGLNVTRVYVDNDISAYGRSKRPEYQSMLRALAQRPGMAVIAWHADRLHRSIIELENYIEVCEATGATTYTVKAGQFDLATSSGRMIARMLGSAARYESDLKGERIRRSIEQNARAGKWTGGARPFGWVFVDGKPVLDPAESEIVVEIFHHVLRGGSLGSKVTALNDLGIATSMGNRWSYATVRQLLLRPRNAGLAEWNGEIVGVSEFPAIVGEDVWRAVCSILKDPSRRRSQTNKAKYLLAGIATCPCGSVVRSGLTTLRDGTKHRHYRCKESGAGHVGKRISFVDDVVNRWAIAWREIMSAAESSPVVEVDTSPLEIEMVALRRRLDDVALQAADGDITPSQFRLFSRRIQDNLLRLEGEMVAARSQPAPPPAVIPTLSSSVSKKHADEWFALPLDDRRDWVRKTLDVTLLPHGKGSTKVFNPATVRVLPKGSTIPRTLEEQNTARRRAGLSEI